MATVLFDSEYGVYYVEVPSDTDPFAWYVVTYDPASEEFGCECPAFRYSGKGRHCKHIARHGLEISDHIDALAARGRAAAPVTTVPDEPDTDDERMYEVTLNDAAPLPVTETIAKWLTFDALRVGDAVTVQRVR